MHRFSAVNLARGLLPKAFAGAQRNETYQGDDAGSYRPALLASGDAEMAEQVVSDAMVRACVLGCGSPRRGCGIPAEDHCLLAMLGPPGRAGPASRAELRRSSAAGGGVVGR